jgi:hypothetical protein
VCVACVECVWCGDVDAREAYGVGTCNACGVGCVPSDVACGAQGVRGVHVACFALSIDCEFSGLLCWQIFLDLLCVLLEEYVW